MHKELSRIASFVGVNSCVSCCSRDSLLRFLTCGFLHQTSSPGPLSLHPKCFFPFRFELAEIFEFEVHSAVSMQLLSQDFSLRYPLIHFPVVFSGIWTMNMSAYSPPIRKTFKGVKGRSRNMSNEKTRIRKSHETIPLTVCIPIITTGGKGFNNMNLQVPTLILTPG